MGVKEKFQKFIGLEKLITTLLFVTILVFRNLVSAVNWFDILELGAAVFIIDFLIVIRDKDLINSLMPDDQVTVKYLIRTIILGIFSLAMSYGIVVCLNQLLSSILNENDKFSQGIGIVVLAFFRWLFFNYSVLFSAYAIAFFIYLFFGKKIKIFIEKE